MDYPAYALSCKAYYNKLWSAERAEFIDIQRGKNWNLVPSVGLAFGLPTVGVNTGQIAAYKARQAEVKAKLKSIDLKYQLLLNEQLNLIRIEVEKAKNEDMKLQVIASTNGTRDQIFKIHQEAFRKKEMRPLDFYREKLAHEQADQTYLLAVREFAVQVLEVERLAHYGMPAEQIAYDDHADPERPETSLMDVLPSKLPAGFVSGQKTGIQTYTDGKPDPPGH